MATDIRNYVKSKLQEYNSLLDVRDGSVICDILINPLSLILHNYTKAQENLLEQLAMTDVAAMPESTMDAIANTYLVERQTGTKTTGQIYLYYLTPPTVSVPKNTVFVTKNGLEFETSSDYYISRTAMENNISAYPYYTAGPIDIISKGIGEEYNLSSETSFLPSVKLLSTPSKITNPEPFINGVTKETNTELYSRVQNTLSGDSLSSPRAIKNFITAYDSSLTQIEVIGAGSPFMFRDIVYDVTGTLSRKVEDFKYAYSGQHGTVYDVQHIAYSDAFMDIDTSAEVALPSVGSWNTEFSNNMYQGIYFLDAPNHAESTENIIIEDFKSGIVTDLVANGWLINDTVGPENNVFEVKEIETSVSGVKLGNIRTTDGDTVVKIPLQQLLDQTGGLRGTQTPDEGNVQVDPYAFAQAVALLEGYIDPAQFNNFSPILHKHVSMHTGICVEVKMSTTDSTDYGEIAYITVLRNDAVYSAHDGYGMAWKKQPAYLIRMQNNNYGGNTELLQSDLALFYNEYLTSGLPYLGAIKSYPEYWKYNVFLVDNNALQEEVWVGREQIVDQTSGKNSFLEAAKVWIEPNVSYNFKYNIFEGFGFEGWVWQSSTSFNESNRTLYKGQSYPKYIPVAGAKTINAITGQMEINEARNHFGIAVGETRNNEWLASELKVWSILENFPMHMFSILPESAKFNVAGTFNLDYYGYAYDKNLVLDAGYTGNRSKLKLGIFNYHTNSWQTLGYNTYDPHSVIYSGTTLQVSDIHMGYELSPLSYYTDGGGRIHVAATPANSGPSFPDNTNHTIRTHYVSVDNGDLVGAHRGNCTDIYIHDPVYIAEGSVAVILTSVSIETASIPGTHAYIQEILGVREYLTQTEINGADYTITNVSEGNTYSTGANYKITFNSASYYGTYIEVYYKYWTRGSTLDNLLVNSDNRFPSADYKVKIYPPVVVHINKLEYSGGLAPKEMKQIIITYINNLEDISFDKSDLVNLLYLNGATYVNLNIEIELREYDLFMSKTLVNFTGQQYTVPDTLIARLYTDITELHGVSQI